MTELKDVLHLYLGCLGILKDGSAPVRISSVSTSGVVSVSDPNAIDAGMYVGIEEITLLLRPLTTMTHEECLELCKKAAPNQYGDYRFSKWIVDRDKNETEYWKAFNVTNEKSKCSFTVDLIDGTFMVYNDGESDYCMVLPCYWHWYLKKSFAIPIFPENKTLIELGLAKDIFSFAH